MAEPMTCDICSAEFEGKAFNLTTLTEVPELLEVCEACAGAQYVQLRSHGLDLVVHRDDYLRADRDRLDFALDKVHVVLEDMGWSLEAIKLQASSDTICEPYSEYD